MFASNKAFAFSGSGSGTSVDPYVITSCALLQEMEDELDADYALGNDFACSSSFTPVGDDSTQFTGTLDGAGFTIDNLEITSSTDYVGLFGYTNGATISDLSLTNATVTATAAGDVYVATLVGRATDTTIDGVDIDTTMSIGGAASTQFSGGMIGYMWDGELSDCSASGEITYSQNASNSGGVVGTIQNANISDTTSTVTMDFQTSDVEGNLVGVLAGNIGGIEAVTVTNCSTDGEILAGSDSSNVGGFAGNTNDFVTISDSHSTSSVSAWDGSEYVAGFVGRLVADVTDSYVDVEITTGSGSSDEADYVGCFAGTIHSSSEISDSYAEGSIVATGIAGSAGGFAGENNGTISNSYSTCTITGGGSDVGGFVGDQYGDISNSWSSGDISGEDYIGGFLGYMDEGSVSNSYTVSDVTCTADYDDAVVGCFAGYLDTDYDGATIDSSYCSSDITYSRPSTTLGGFVAYLYGSDTTTTENYWNDTLVDVSDDNTMGTGLTTEQMKVQSNYVGWDFDTVWEIVEGQNSDLPSHSWFILTLDLSEETSEETSRNAFQKDLSCNWSKPPVTTWIQFEPREIDGVSGMYLTWTQYAANLIDILIDDGTGNFPWKLSKTSNDGHEFLPNVASWQNVKIRAVEHCRTGDSTPAVSASSNPNGWFNE